MILGIALLHQHDSSTGETFSDAGIRCQGMLNKTSGLYKPHYARATVLAGQAVCDPNWKEESKRADLLALAIDEYRQALEICPAEGVVQEAIRDLELIRAAGIEGLEPVFELLESNYDEVNST